MRCQICNAPTDEEHSEFSDLEGLFISICEECIEIIEEALDDYEIEEEEDEV